MTISDGFSDGPGAQTDPRAKQQAAKGSDTLHLTPEQRTSEPFESQTVAKGLGGEQIEGSTGPILKSGAVPQSAGGNGGGDKDTPPKFHKRAAPDQFAEQLQKGKKVVARNTSFVMILTCATNILVLAIPLYLFQISDRVLTSRSTDTLIMLTIVIAFAVILQSTFDAVRRFILMRTAVEVAVRLGAPVLSAAAHSSLHDNGREYQTWATCSFCAVSLCLAR